jgi:hypothetical protein
VQKRKLPADFESPPDFFDVEQNPIFAGFRS